MSVFAYDSGLVQATAASLDLRTPNRDALTTIAVRVDEHFSADEPVVPYEAVVDVATGVGKTFVIAAAIDYFAAQGVRNFAIIAPGRTVARKTVANFTPGAAKSLLPGLEIDPVVITAENFGTPAVAGAMDDPELVKVYIFTVQALLKPTTTMGRKTHDYSENLGAAFYERLRSAADLVVLADEHHLYGGPAFDRAVMGLEPQLLLGFTATPLTQDKVIYRYPLAAAIADRYVKTPVIVGRRDDRSDAYTKLTDGIRLLDAKQARIEAYRAVHPDEAPVHAVMLVMCPSKDDADEVEQILTHERFEGGRFADAVLKIYSDVEDMDGQLEKLDAVEDPDSQVRIIVAVGMLKEGWDVKNVYVICSLRASVSQILTEQTLGRGLRLPFGRYTDDSLLDTLEVIAHERYEALIRQVDKVKESFLDYRTVVRPVAPTNGGPADAAAPTIAREDIGLDVATGTEAAPAGEPAITPADERIEAAEADVRQAPTPLYPRDDAPPVSIPLVRGEAIENPFSLNDITDLTPFRTDGHRVAAMPADRLRRTVVGARVIEEGGERAAQWQRTTAEEEITSAAPVKPLADAIADVMDRVSAAGVVPARAGQRARLRTFVDAFVEGIGGDAAAILSAYPHRAADAIVKRIREAQKDHLPRPRFDGPVELVRFDRVREARPTVLTDRFGPFVRGVGFTGFRKSVYPHDWFDSKTAELDLANLIDDAPEVAVWLRLQRGDLRLPWRSTGEEYNPDFVVVETDGSRWVVEGKRDTDADRADVKAKAEAARRWANHVSAETGEKWGYLFALESDIRAAKGSWPALKRLAAEH